MILWTACQWETPHPQALIEARIESRLKVSDLRGVPKALARKIEHLGPISQLEVVPVRGAKNVWICSFLYENSANELDIIWSKGTKVCISHPDIKEGAISYKWMHYPVEFRMVGKYLVGAIYMVDKYCSDACLAAFYKHGERWICSEIRDGGPGHASFSHSYGGDIIWKDLEYFKTLRNFKWPWVSTTSIFHFHQGHFRKVRSSITYNYQSAFDDLVTACRMGDVCTQRARCPNPRWLRKLRGVMAFAVKGRGAEYGLKELHWATFKNHLITLRGYEGNDYDVANTTCFKMGLVKGHWQVVGLRRTPPESQETFEEPALYHFK